MQFCFKWPIGTRGDEAWENTLQTCFWRNIFLHVCLLVESKSTYGKKPNSQLSVSLTHCCLQYKSKIWHLNFPLEFRIIVCLSPVHLLGIPHATPPKLLVLVPFGGGRMEAWEQLGDSGELATLPGAQRVSRATPASCGLLWLPIYKIYYFIPHPLGGESNFCLCSLFVQPVTCNLLSQQVKTEVCSLLNDAPQRSVCV